MKILFVIPRLPYPTDTGAKIRTLNLMKQARAGGHRLVVLSFVFGPQDEENVAHLRGMGFDVIAVAGEDRLTARVAARALRRGLPLSVAKYRSQAMAACLLSVIDERRIDLVHFDHIHMAQYLDMIPGVPCVIDEHNVEYLILERVRKQEKNLLKRIALRRESAAMKNLEKRLCRRAFATCVVSEADKRLLAALCGAGAHVEVVPNGVDVEYFHPGSCGRRPSEKVLVFTGSMDWLPNADAVEYFCRDILPLIWAKRSDVRFYVVGKGPSQKIKEWEKRDQRIVVTGGVTDVRPYVEDAAAFVVPLRIGGGTRLKILEAMAMARPVISTSIGAEGISCTDRVNILLADTPQDFAEKVVGVLSSPEAARRLAEAARHFACHHYDWKIVGKTLNRIYARMAL